MKTTASPFFINTINTWSGIRFSVMDSESNIFFESETRSPAVAASHYLKNNIKFIEIKDNKIRLSAKSFLEFNSLITKYGMGRPLSRDVLSRSKIKMKNGVLDMENGLYISSSTILNMLDINTLEGVFLAIAKKE